MQTIKKRKEENIKLANLRKKADYEPYQDLTPQDVSDAINHMEKIFDHLKFD
ncbi:MAG: HEPN domain-containing protein [Methanobrevibacter sp.]|nr:HEPN domain-containing protein [Methanobrevibacter sp.]MBQ6630293.1 HEPN domain-containing protein [Methanobrevibacter sp.]